MQALPVVVVALLIVAARGAEVYKGAWTKVDVDEVLRNERLLKNYINCFMEKGPCTPDASDIKKIIPDGLQHDCDRCSPEDKKKVDKVIKFLIHEKMDLFEEMCKKYDPEMKYQKKYEDYIKKAKEGS